MEIQKQAGSSRVYQRKCPTKPNHSPHLIQLPFSRPALSSVVSLPVDQLQQQQHLLLILYYGYKSNIIFNPLRSQIHIIFAISWKHQVVSIFSTTDT
ncbi:hypothetical protein E2C01_066373 [Portunus trituberculatus]|uniref:Uncharacterized protein n=1 Tax=Portunus trituberculatus TaxID=210409 RepID=A0A5B7HI16_PORTR|nr:hypothetical protein [Portunus trituberculatus]